MHVSGGPKHTLARQWTQETRERKCKAAKFDAVGTYACEVTCHTDKEDRPRGRQPQKKVGAERKTQNDEKPGSRFEIHQMCLLRDDINWAVDQVK